MLSLKRKGKFQLDPISKFKKQSAFLVLTKVANGDMFCASLKDAINIITGVKQIQLQLSVILATQRLLLVSGTRSKVDGMNKTRLIMNGTW